MTVRGELNLNIILMAFVHGRNVCWWAFGSTDASNCVSLSFGRTTTDVWQMKPFLNSISHCSSKEQVVLLWTTDNRRGHEKHMAPNRKGKWGQSWWIYTQSLYICSYYSNLSFEFRGEMCLWWNYVLPTVMHTSLYSFIHVAPFKT